MSELEGDYVKFSDYQELRAENKSIKELDKTHRKLLKDHVEINELLIKENKALKEELVKIKKSRNELLEGVKQSEIVFRNSGLKERAKMLVPLIKRAET